MGISARALLALALAALTAETGCIIGPGGQIDLVRATGDDDGWDEPDRYLYDPEPLRRVADLTIAVRNARSPRTERTS